MAPMNYGVTLNSPSEPRAANVNVLDNKVGTQRPRRLHPAPTREVPPANPRRARTKGGRGAAAVYAGMGILAGSTSGKQKKKADEMQ